MDSIKREISRRNLFRFLGNSVVFLPFMRTLLETQAFGEVARRRAVFFFYPDGNVPDAFHATGTGSNFTLPESTKPLNAVKSDIIMLNNVNYDTGKGLGGRHQQGNNYGLTGCEGKISNVSIDTYLGQKIPGTIPVLRLGVAHTPPGLDTMHYAISFSATSASGSPSISQIEGNPMKAFSDLFGGGILPSLSSNLQKSLLDDNLEQIKALQNKLGTIEKDKLNSHLDSIRELERRLQSTTEEMAANHAVNQCKKPLSRKQDFLPDELMKSGNFDVIADLQIEVATQALACGVTNVIYLQMSHGTSRLNLAGGKPADAGRTLHETSHYAAANSRSIHIANQAYMMGKLTKLIKGMSAVKEGDKSLLYNSSVLAFSELSDSDAHNYKNMGLIVGGQAGGFFKTGRCINGEGYTNNNLLVSMLQGMGLKDNKFGNKDNGKGGIPALTKV